MTEMEHETAWQSLLGSLVPKRSDAGDELNQHLAAIVQSSQDAILAKNLDGIITSWNGGAEKLFGYTADEAIGQPVTMLIPEERIGEEPSIISRIRRGERIEHYETKRRHKSGRLVDISLSVSPIKNPQGVVIGASKIARDITELRRAVEQQELILGEMKHRAKNLFAVIEALARQSRPRNEPAVDAFIEVFTGRIRALLSAGELVVGDAARRADFSAVVEIVLAPFNDPQNDALFARQGPRLSLSEATAAGLALAIHELATNALKYGALRSPAGRVSLTWGVEAERVRIQWREYHGERPSEAPRHAGFGTRVIKAAVARERDGNVDLNFAPDGLICTFEFGTDGDLQ